MCEKEGSSICPRFPLHCGIKRLFYNGRMRKIFLLVSVLFYSFSLWSCTPPEGKPLIIGCSYKCSFTYRIRLNNTARALGYKIKIVDMRDLGSLPIPLQKVDGVLIPGGADINPEYYLDDVTPELQQYVKDNLFLVNFSEEGRKRDPFEHALVKLYSEDEKYSHLPLLGICRGMQMMSVAQGIPLYLDIKTEVGIPNRIRKFDRIHPERDGNLMHKLYGDSSFRGFKLHHQGIRVPYYEAHRSSYPLTRITSYSNDSKIAESLEYLHRPALGVQYHPEMSVTSVAAPVMRWFLKKACEYKNMQKDDL